MLGLTQQVCCHPCGVAAAVGQHQNFAGACDHIDAHLAEHLALGGGNVDVAGADDLVHRRDALGAIGQRGHGLRTAGLEDLGKGLRSQVGTMYGTLKKGPRYLEMAEGYVTGIALDKDNQIIGYKFVSLGKMTDFIKKGDDPTTAYEKACGQYGRVADAVKIIDPRTDEEVK